MRSCIAVLLLTAGIASLCTGQQDEWLSIQPDKDLKGWKRTAIPPAKDLDKKNAWSSDGKVLYCAGEGIKEMLLHERSFKNCMFHVEWRFKKLDGKKDYNSGVYVRSMKDGKNWVQAQIAHLDKRPMLADLFADITQGDEARRAVIEGDGHKHAHSPGEWNAYDVRCEGKLITVAVNGKPATRWEDCPLAEGHLGLQAEFYEIEFKNMKVKLLP